MMIGIIKRFKNSKKISYENTDSVGYPCYLSYSISSAKIVLLTKKPFVVNAIRSSFRSIKP